MEKAILHSDLNAFYASVEQMNDPSLRGKAVAVCGSTEDRHGIVLAKSQLAKQAGVKTGMVNWEARQKCPGLIIVPPHYEEYLKYSRLTREIYERYTDQVEPYGMDECWLDVTASRVFGSPMEIAEKIRITTYEELGLTVSIGVSFNKVFAKLGSDMKKPDAITEITRQNYRAKVWPLPADELLFVGRSTAAKLRACGITTIGQLAALPADIMHAKFGKNGLQLLAFARGEDRSPVAHKEFISPVKSIGHGITCTADLVNAEEVGRVILYLSQDIGHKLRIHGLAARGVQITIKDCQLAYRQLQRQLQYTTQSPKEITLAARELFRANYDWRQHVRAITVRVINLTPKETPVQLDLACDVVRREKQARLEDTIDRLRGRFGEDAIKSASLLGELKIPKSGTPEIIMPGMRD